MIKLFKSLFKSITGGIKENAEIKLLADRYPRFFGFIRKRISPDSKFGLYLTIGGIFAFVFIFLFFNITDAVVGQGPLIQSDLRIINFLQIFRAPSFDNAMFFITYLGELQIVFMELAVAGIILAFLKRWHYLIALIVSVVGGELFIWFIKNIIERPRPQLLNALAMETSFSFPSGHSFLAVSFYGLLGYFLFQTTKNKLFKILSIFLCAIIILAIGFSRIYLGVHWPSDVLAGYASAMAWLIIVITALEIRKKL